ncbi:hypothetical protein [Streptomyces sp. NPDC002990]
MRLEQVFTYAWKGSPEQDGTSVLSVAYEPPEAGGARRWLLLAGMPVFTELLPFTDAAQAREFARAVLDLPLTAEFYERELHLRETSTRMLLSGPATQERFATLTVGRDPVDELRAYFAYQSYFGFPGPPAHTALGLEVVCDDVDVVRAHAEASQLLAALEEDSGPA